MGVIFGGIVSWIVTHWYYKKQEQASPAPLIKEINDKIQKIYDLSVVKKDKQLQSKFKDLAQTTTVALHRIAHLLLPLDIDTQGLYEVYQSGDKQKFNEYLNEMLPNLFKFHEKFCAVVKELENLRHTTEEIAQDRREETNKNVDVA